MLRAARGAWPWVALPVAAVVAIDPSGLAPFGPIKWALVPALVLAGIALLLRDGRLRIGRGWALPAFVGWTAVTAGVGLDGLYAWTGTPERHLGVIAWVLVLLAWWGGRSLDGAARQRVFASCATVAGVIGLWAGAEALGWKPLDLVGIGDRPVGPLGSSAFLGAAAVLVTPIALGWSMQARGRVRVAAIGAAGLGLVALAASGARAAIFGAIVVSVLALVAHRDRRLLVIVGVCAALGVGVALATGASDRVSSVASDRQGGAHGRLDEWRIALRVIADHPVIGTGPEGYRIAFGDAVDDRYERAHGRNPLPDRAHSAPLDIAATTGLVGLALYVAAVGAALAAAWQALRRRSPLVAGAALGVIAYFVQSLFLFPIAELEPVVWLLAGTLSVHRSPRIAGRTVHRTRLAGVVAVVAVLALVAGALDVVSDRRAKRELGAIASGEFVHATAAKLRPDQVRYWLADASVHESDGTDRGLRRALDDIEHALDVSPHDPVVQREKGRLLLAQARRGTSPSVARGYLGALSRRDPHDAETLLRLGIAHDLAGDAAGAIAAWRRAEYLAPRSAAASTNLAVAYARAGRRTAARKAAERALQRDPQNETAFQLLEELKENGT